MSALPVRRWTEEEYLTVERASDIRHEFYRGEIFAMAGASLNHNRIVSNTSGSLYAQLRNGSCEVFQNDLRLKVGDAGLYTYPDVMVVCGKPALTDDHEDTITNPILIIEVLSDSTEKYDRVGKFLHYRKLDSLKEYVLISQNSAHIERSLRQPDGQWLLKDVNGLDESLELVSIQCTLSLREVYARVEFEEPQE